MDDFDIAQSKIGESAQRVVDRAVEESRRRDHALLTNEHIFLAFAQVEWDTFSQVMRDLELNPHEILQALEEHLHVLPTFAGRELRVAPATKLVFKLALPPRPAAPDGRRSKSSDLFSAIFEESQGVPVSIIRRHGVEPEVLVSRIATRMRDIELREERLRKRFELPPFLKHFATNLNLLARQDKMPPVFGRDQEIQQVLEILCHRERANSVMLIGEPGVGKTAIVEGLARRIEFEPETRAGPPARLPGGQPADEHDGRRHDAARHVRGPDPERDPRAEGAAEPDSVHRRGAHDGRRRLGARRAVGRRQRLQVGARARRGPHGRRDHAQRVQGIHPGRRGARAPLPHACTSPSRRIEETRRILYNLRPRLERNYSVRLLDEAIETALEMSPRYMRHLHLPDKVIGWLDTAAVRAEIDRRWEVTSDDVVAVISNAAQIPKDMVFRDVADRFKDIEAAPAASASSARRRRSRRWRTGWC